MSHEENNDNETGNLEISAPLDPIKAQRQKMGDNLRKLREAKGLEQKDVIHLTRISPPFIRALEDGDFDVLPGEVFGRGFLKNICRVLEIAPEPLLEEFKKCYQNTGGKIPKQRATFKQKNWNFNFQRLIRTTSRYKWPVIATSAIILALVFLIKQSPRIEQKPEEKLAELNQNIKPNALAQQEDEQEDVQQEQEDSDVFTSEQEKLQATESAPETEAKTKSDVLQLKAVNKDATKAEDSPSTSLLVVAVTNEDVEISLTIDGKELGKKSYTKGSYNFSFADNLNFWVSDPSKVTLQFNGKKLGIGPSTQGAKRLSFHGKNHKLQTM